MDARDALWESATGLSIPQIHLVNPEAERQDGAQESKTTGCEDRSAIGIFFWCLQVRSGTCVPGYPQRHCKRYPLSMPGKGDARWPACSQKDDWPRIARTSISEESMSKLRPGRSEVALQSGSAWAANRLSASDIHLVTRRSRVDFSSALLLALFRADLCKFLHARSHPTVPSERLWPAAIACRLRWYAATMPFTTTSWL